VHGLRSAAGALGAPKAWKGCKGWEGRKAWVSCKAWNVCKKFWCLRIPQPQLQFWNCGQCLLHSASQAKKGWERHAVRGTTGRAGCVRMSHAQLHAAVLVRGLLEEAVAGEVLGVGRGGGVEDELALGDVLRAGGEHLQGPLGMAALRPGPGSCTSRSHSVSSWPSPSIATPSAWPGARRALLYLPLAPLSGLLSGRESPPSGTSILLPL